jgi:DNA-binding NarL/FixJ family response regulator
MSDRIRVVLADDHALVREGTAELLERAGGVQIVGQAADGPDALRLVQALRPDVLLIDVAMPGLDGIETTRRSRTVSPHTAVLALSAHEEVAYVRAMLEAGAQGYLSKAARAHELVAAVRAVAAGETVLSPGVASRVLSRTAGSTPDLTPRELDMLRAAARGLGNKQIGTELGVSARTVQTHLTRVFAKLGVASRTEAVLYAIKRGWVLPDQGSPG